MKKYLLLLISLCLAIGLHAQKNEELQYSDIIECFDAGKYDEAMKLNSQFLLNNPKHIEANWNMGFMPYTKRKYDESIRGFEAFKSMLKRRDVENHIRANWFLGYSYRYAGDKASAIRCFERVLELDSEHVTVMANLADIYIENKNYSKAEDLLQKGLVISENDAAIWDTYCQFYYRTNDNSKALESINKAIAIDPKYARYHYAKAFLLEDKGDVEGALKHYARSLSLYNGKDKETQNAIVRLSIQNYGEALRAIDRELENGEDDAWNELRARVFSENGRHDRAVKEYSRLINGKTKDQASYYMYMRAMEYQELGFHKAAIKDFETVRVYYPKYEYLYGAMADSYRLLTDFNSAIEHFSIAIELAPGEAWFYYRRGWCKEYVEDYKGALADYNESIDINPDYSYSYLQRGRLFEKYLNQAESAKRDYEKILELDTVPTSIGNCRQYALMHLGQKQEAIAWMNHILESFPDEAGFYYDALCMYAAMDEEEAAILHLELALEKGYTNFGHLATDDDLDNVRNLEAFKVLIEKWKQIHGASQPKEVEEKEKAIGYRRLVG
ncbi:tetratricopeptide repeat protein [Carboxylicivirga sp. N1Y90]|uniref:tetratricopeptide repeat protein n=1 Tax=Carboxylicivirga fragile TaxID=3417571 RepID=UPI003D336DA7|nr:tetratricopeptide repeat protein [Marinilabiliaceae bacterium N1Y90]